MVKIVYIYMDYEDKDPQYGYPYPYPQYGYTGQLKQNKELKKRSMYIFWYLIYDKLDTTKQ